MTNALPTLALQQLQLSEIKRPARLTRKHSQAKIKKLAASIVDTAYLTPILVDEALFVIAGNARLDAAARLGMHEEPGFVIRGLSEGQKRRLALADNRLAEQASWDEETLALELRELLEMDFESLDQTGFDTPDTDLLISPKPLGLLEDEEQNLPDVPEVATSRLGDLWLCGLHTVVCGDARESAAYVLGLNGQKADVVFTDAPYGVSIANDISQRGKKKHADFVMASGELDDAGLSRFFGESLARMKEFSREGAVAFSFIDWRHVHLMVNAGIASFGKLLNICVWSKTNASLGTFYRSQHELVVVLQNGEKRFTNNLPLGRKRRHRSNIWTYAGNSSNTKARKEELASHPTVKPTALIADALEDVSAPGELVLDPFGGSGSTMIAAHAIKRRAALIEIHPKYVDVILMRFKKATGIEPTLAETGETFEQVKLRRAGAANEKFPEWKAA